MQMSQPVTSQPGEKVGSFATGTNPPLGCPPGLEYLAQMNEIYLNQKVDLLEILTNTALEVPNRYSVENSAGQRVYFAQEESECCNRMCCGPNRGFVMHITLNDGREVIRCEREFKCCAGCCWCADGYCGWEMSVEAPVGNLIGYIRQHSSKWKTHLTLYDANRQKLYDIWSKCCPIFCICCIDDINFYISVTICYNSIHQRESFPFGCLFFVAELFRLKYAAVVFDAKSQNKISPRIYKKWAGCVRECCTRADLLVCEFPGMDVKEKALFVCTAFMLDVMVFEPQKKNNN